jgi:diacylglycerol O-acyltransferase / wax synthase
MHIVRRNSATPQRLSGLDTAFLAIETPHSQMHTLKLSILESATGGPLDVETVKAALRRQLYAVPCYTQKLQLVPFGLHHPLLVGVKDFDVDRHIRVVKVPAPGDRLQRDHSIANICGGALDRGRPLWELWILDGLEGGRIGCLLKLHHCLADGRVATNQLLALTGADPGDPRLADTALPTGRLVLEALRDRVTDLTELPSTIATTVRAVRATRAIRDEADVMVPGMFGGTRTRFSQRVSAQRTWGTATVPVSALTRAAKGFGVSVNDVLLTMVGTAVRHYLDSRGELPDTSLAAGLPVDASSPEDAGALQGNKWSMVMTTLATDVADVVDRLYAVHDCMTVSKAIRREKSDLLEAWARYINLPLVQALMRVSSTAGLLGRAKLTSFGISNVKGPAESMRIGPLRVVDFYSVGPLMEGSGVNVTAWSFAGRFNISVLSARNILDDGGEFLGLMVTALDELIARLPARAADGASAARAETS